MVYRLELTCDETVDKLDLKKIAVLTNRHALQPGIYQISNGSLMLKSLISEDVKVNKTIEDVRLRSILTTNKQKSLLGKILFLNKIMFYSTTLRSFKRSSTRTLSKNSRNLEE